MSPPRPPLPPSGPPSGTNFSRWMDTQPSPPLPAEALSVTRSTNEAISYLSLLIRSCELVLASYF